MSIELTVPLKAVLEEKPNGVLFLHNSIKLAPYPANLAVWLRQNAARFPDKPFLLERSGDGWRAISYSKALSRVNQLSNGLLALNLEPSAPIAILSPNCINMALIQLAAMQIGLPVVPISYAYSVRSQTGSLIKHILDVTAAPVLIMSDANVHMSKMGQWEGNGRHLYAFSHSQEYNDVHDFATLFAPETDLTHEAEAHFQAVTHDTLAKIQFTSGSTSLPKGVEITHGMMTSNQAAIYQMWPFLHSQDVLVDWLPWNHTFGGNFVFNITLRHGATMYIDNGNPTPAGLDHTVANIMDVQPTVYFGVPASYAALYGRMQEDAALRRAFFARLKFIFVAAAALDQKTFEGMQALGRQEIGHDIPFFSAWGTTETAPSATLVYWRADDIRVIGLPHPGTTLKLVPNEADRYEVRVTGPNITKGYYNNEQATAVAFDSEGYYCTGDAVAFLDRANPNAGLIFDGRLGEDFKLTSGVWVRSAHIRASLNNIGKPYLMEVVLAAPNKPYLNALVIPHALALRDRFAELSDAYPTDADFLHLPEVVALFRSVFQEHNHHRTGSSQRIVRFTILTQPLQFDRGEATDKGYINQRAVLQSNAELVERFYAEEVGDDVWEV